MILSNSAISNSLEEEEEYILSHSPFPTYRIGTEMIGSFHKTEIESLVRQAYKYYRRKGERYGFRRASEYDNINRMEVLNNLLLSNPPIYHLKDIRDYLKGDRKEKRKLKIVLNHFDKPQYSLFNEKFYSLVRGLLIDKVLLISYLDDLRENNAKDFKALKWNFNELQIIKLHSKLVENEIIDRQISVGEFYQIFDNHVAIFDNPIQINSMSLACLIFWCKEKNYLETLQPFKIIEQMKMFCTKKGKLINSHNLNRYISEYKYDFKDCTNPIYNKIKAILSNL